MRRAIVRLILMGFAAAFGFGVGYLVGAAPYLVPMSGNDPELAELIPLPHHVPEHPGGISFRFAMAHDVIHERFPKHGPAHYRERDRLTREQLAPLGLDDPARFPLLDDLAVGMERLGKANDAIEVIRDKLARQRKAGISGRELYTTFANLGTFLIHGNFKAAMGGDPEAKARFREGVEFIRESVKVNPEAHFGRERWQAAIAEFLLASMDNPKLLLTFDCLGNRLDAGIDTMLDREGNWTQNGYGRPNLAYFNYFTTHQDVPKFFESEVDLEDPKLWPELREIRKQITKVGAEEGWDAVPVPSHRQPVPFDEPVLGIIGMWRQGGGANPHFNLALGETMLRVGQRYIAWSAFERGERMAERFWPDEAIQNSFREHCRKRRVEIEQSLIQSESHSQNEDLVKVVAPPGPGLQLDFDQQLKLGTDFQSAYQSYEEEKINGDFSISDDHFFDKFTISHPSIATQPGSEEFFAGISLEKKGAYAARRGRAFGILGGGIAASLAVGCFAFLNWFRRPFKPSVIEAPLT
jgi:hypothetical protein